MLPEIFDAGAAVAELPAVDEVALAQGEGADQVDVRPQDAPRADADGALHFWDRATAKPTATLGAGQNRRYRFSHGVQYTPDGKLLVSAGDAVTFWDAVNKNAVR